jgi:hypothetical protein
MQPGPNDRYTRIEVPQKLGHNSYKNIFTGESVQVKDNYHTLSASRVFGCFPVAVLERDLQ